MTAVADVRRQTCTNFDKGNKSLTSTMVLNGELNICQQKSEICLLKYLSKENLKMKYPALTGKPCPSRMNEMQVDACIFSVIKKMDERFVQTTEKKAKFREERP